MLFTSPLPIALLSRSWATGRSPSGDAPVRAARSHHADAPDPIVELGSLIARCFPKNLRAITGIQHPSVKKIGECWFALTAGRIDGEAATAELRKACRDARNPGPPKFTPEQTMRFEDLIAHGRHASLPAKGG